MFWRGVVLFLRIYQNKSLLFLLLIHAQEIERSDLCLGEKPRFNWKKKKHPNWKTCWLEEEKEGGMRRERETRRNERKGVHKVFFAFALSPWGNTRANRWNEETKKIPFFHKKIETRQKCQFFFSSFSPWMNITIIIGHRTENCSVQWRNNSGSIRFLFPSPFIIISHMAWWGEVFFKMELDRIPSHYFLKGCRSCFTATQKSAAAMTGHFFCEVNRKMLKRWWLIIIFLVRGCTSDMFYLV